MPNKNIKHKKSAAKKKTPKLTRFYLQGLSAKARLLTFSLLFANVVTITLLIVSAATAGLSNSKEADQISRLNSYRSSNNRTALGNSACLSGIARDWAMQMGQRNKLAHSNDTGSGIYSQKYDYTKQVPVICGGAWQKMGENVGRGYDSVSLFNAFVSSTGHRANLLNDFTNVGIGVYISTDGQLWVAQIFAKCPSCGGGYSKASRNVGEPGSNFRDSLTGGQKLTPGQRITAKNGSYDLVMQGDGNLVLYRYWGGAVWNSATAGSSSAYSVFQSDGNLVLYRSGVRPCQSGTYNKGGKTLSLGGDGNLAIYTGTGSVIWSSKTSAWHC